MKKIIMTCGYMGSGSSAATDLVSEYKNINNDHRDFEYVFLHCPNGVFDLEDKLLIGNNSIRSDEAIHSFLNTMKDLYDKKFWWPGYYKNIIGPDFYNEVLKYINELIDIESNNYWYYQENPTRKMQLKKACYELLARLKGKHTTKKVLRYDKILLSYKRPEEFYEITRKFIYKILDMIDSDNDNTMLLDQLFLPHNLYRIDNYFKDDEIKAIVVERDPREIFVLNKYAWAKKGIDVPYSFDVKKFCKQYKSIREMEKIVDSKNVLRIRFEDLVYNYDETEKKVTKFLGYEQSDHINKFKRFNPEISIKNTQVFLSSEEYKEECEYIEKELGKYLYNFPRKVYSKIEETID